MKTGTFFSFRSLILAVVLSGAFATNSFATRDTIRFGGSPPSGPGKTFAPDNLTVPVGDTIVWIGFFGTADPFHQLQSETIPLGAQAFGPVSSGMSFSYHVTVAGHYHYQCNIHCCGPGTANMMGDFTAGTADVKESVSNGTVTLEKNYPNPFARSTTIPYTLMIPTKVALRLFDINGKEVKMLVNTFQNAGSYEMVFDGSALPNGTYMYQLQAGDAVLAKELVISR
jgi:plastocyanin